MYLVPQFIQLASIADSSLFPDNKETAFSGRAEILDKMYDWNSAISTWILDQNNQQIPTIIEWLKFEKEKTVLKLKCTLTLKHADDILSMRSGCKFHVLSVALKSHF